MITKVIMVGGPSSELRNHSLISCSSKSRAPELTTQLTENPIVKGL